jgi:hypothetical protein
MYSYSSIDARQASRAKQDELRKNLENRVYVLTEPIQGRFIVTKPNGDNLKSLFVKVDANDVVTHDFTWRKAWNELMSKAKKSASSNPSNPSKASSESNES